MATITTSLGEMDESLLEVREGLIDDDNERTTWIEHWPKGTLAPALEAWEREHPGVVANGGEMLGYVKRSADIKLKKALFAMSEAGDIPAF